MGRSVSHRVTFLTVDDFDKFREALWGWDTEPIQLSSGRLSVSWEQIAFDDIAISRLRTDKKIVDRSANRPNFVSFVVCLAPQTFCGIAVPAGSMFLCGPHREHRSFLNETFDAFEITMATEFLQTLDFAPSVFRRIKLGPECSVIHLSPRRVASFRTWSETFLTPFQSQSSLKDELFWADAVRERTLDLLHQAMHEGENINFGPHALECTRGWNLLSRALAFIDEEELDSQLHTTPSVSEISNALNCTQRALQYVFQTALNKSPQQYLLARRLHFARSQLLKARDSSRSVTMAAIDHNFMHFGRFSQYYKLMFSESPSDTVRRAKTTLSSHANRISDPVHAFPRLNDTVS